MDLSFIERTQSKYRRGAKIVAILSCASYGLSVLPAIGLLCDAFSASVADNDSSKAKPFEQDYYYWPGISPQNFRLSEFFVASVAIEIGFGLVAAVKLLQASFGRNPEEDLYLARFWRNVCIIFGVIGWIYYIVTGQYIIFVLSACVRGLMLYIVCKFIKELEAEEEDYDEDIPQIYVQSYADDSIQGYQETYKE